MCNCMTAGTKRSAPTAFDLGMPQHQHQSILSRKRPRGRRVHFSALITEEQEAPPSASSASSSRHPFVATDQWLQPSEQKQQRFEALQEASRMRSEEQSEHFRESYQGIYQICHALADTAASSSASNSDHLKDCEDNDNDSDKMLPKQVGAACTQLLSHSRHEHARGLEDGLVPHVAVARRLERRRAIRTVVALQKHAAIATIATQLSQAHGKFAHALALGDAAAAVRIHSDDGE